MSSVEAKFAVSSKQPFGFDDMMSGFGPSGHGSITSHRFTAPAVMPVTVCRLKNRYTISGRMVIRRMFMKQALRLLRQTARPEAVFCWTDFVAFEVLSHTRELDLHVPGNVAIMGHDNTTFCDLSIAPRQVSISRGLNLAQTGTASHRKDRGTYEKRVRDGRTESRGTWQHKVAQGGDCCPI